MSMTLEPGSIRLMWLKSLQCDYMDVISDCFKCIFYVSCMSVLLIALFKICTSALKNTWFLNALQDVGRRHLG